MGGGIRDGHESQAASRDDEARRARDKDRARSLESYNSKGKARVFISFHIEDEAQVNLLRYQAENSERMEFTDYSVREPFDERWKAQCTERIMRSSVVLVAIGPETYSRPAVIWEINKAHELGKPVIGMRLYNDKKHRIPEPMVRHGDKVIDWGLDAIQDELDRRPGD